MSETPVTPFEYDFFVSYADADRNWTEFVLLKQLRAADKRYITEHTVIAGVPKIYMFDYAIKHSRHILLVVTPDYLSDFEKKFVPLMGFQAAAEQQRWPIIPILLKKISLPLFLNFVKGIDLTDPSTNHLQQLAVLLQQPFELTATIAPIRYPYVGLQAYSTVQASWFFGRNQVIKEWLNDLLNNRLLLIVGASGSGKSSAVMAGLLPALQKAALQKNQPEWHIFTLRPGSQPWQTLCTTLNLDRLTQQPLTPITTPTVLVVDQLEELFTLAQTGQAEFIQALNQLSQQRQLSLILTLRADFYSALLKSALWPVFGAYQKTLGAMSRAELVEAIQRPAEQVGVYIDPVLVERLSQEAGYEPGVLPFLQAALDRLWREREGLWLRETAYEKALKQGELTGLMVAIQAKADSALTRLRPTEQQLIAQQIFIRLVQFGEGKPDTRRQQAVHDLYSGPKQALFDAVLEQLASQERLITLSTDAKQIAYADLAHEALISAWLVKQDWFKTAKEAEYTRRRLVEKVIEWQSLSKQGGLLDKIQYQHIQHTLRKQPLIEEHIDTTTQQFLKASKKNYQRQTQRLIIYPIGLLLLVGAIFIVFNLINNEYYKYKTRELNPLIPVPSDHYIIGSANPNFNESANHSVNWPTFSINQYEASNQMYCFCTKAGICNSTIYRSVTSVCDESIKDLPVVNISLNEAAQYCQWLGLEVPHEIEWEIAYRYDNTNQLALDSQQIGKTLNLLPLGDDIKLDESNYKTWPITKSYKGQKYLSGMSDNVSEWTVASNFSYQKDEYYSTYWTENNRIDYSIIRGANFSNTLSSTGFAYRRDQETAKTVTNIGIRCVNRPYALEKTLLTNRF